MATIFTQIIEGELPGHFVWKDDVCVAFLTIAPLKPGHTLVVPRAEVDSWTDLDLPTMEHLTRVSHAIGGALQEAYQPTKVGMIILGLEVPHVHIHLSCIWKPTDLDFGNADANASPESIAAEAVVVREALRKQGIEFVTAATAEELERWHDISRQALLRLREKQVYSSQMLDALERHLEDFRSRSRESGGE